jgi:ankyrin repeat protein
LGCDEIITVMLERGWADVEMRNLRGLTAMHCASAGANPTTVRKLVNAGADIDAIDNKGRTALNYAEEVKDNNTIVRLLLGLRAKPSRLIRAWDP